MDSRDWTDSRENRLQILDLVEKATQYMQLKKGANEGELLDILCLVLGNDEDFVLLLSHQDSEPWYCGTHCPYS